MFSMACGESNLSDEFAGAVRKKEALDNNHIELFARNPVVDSSDSNINFFNNLDNINRTTLELKDFLDTETPIASETLKVFYDEANELGPSFLYWAGSIIPWRNPDFKTMMIYYHATEAIRFYNEIIPHKSLASESLLPITAYSNIEGAPEGVNYNPQDKKIRFYSHDEDKNLHFADSADVIYHEIGHVFQHALAPSILTNTDNTLATLSLLEGLSDFYAAAVAGDDNILEYLSNSFPYILDLEYSHGSKPLRTLDNELSFPKAFMHQRHLDGRVLAAALNDFRKYLEGLEVRLLNCSSLNPALCTRRLTPGLFERPVAFKNAAKLALLAFEKFGFSSDGTLYFYSKELESTCKFNSSVLSWCSGHSSVLIEILESRGLYFDPADLDNIESVATIDFDSADGGAFADADLDIKVSQNFGWVPFNGENSESNKDQNISPCEQISIFPHISNQSKGLKKGLYYGFARISNLGGFSDVTVNSANISYPAWPKNDAGQSELIAEAVIDGGTRNSAFNNDGYKSIGLLSAPETGVAFSNTLDLLIDPDSHWYKSFHGSSFTRRVGPRFLNSNASWLVRAIDEVNTAMEVTFDLILYPFNSESVEAYQIEKTITQTFQTDANEGFCEYLDNLPDIDEEN